MPMNIIYARQPLPHQPAQSIMLCGPTPRTLDVNSWRPEAIEIFQKLNYDGYLLIPEDESGECRGDYDDQVEWEHDALNVATVIMFWIPRNHINMPALTTNDEWGTWKYSGKVVLGVPPEAVKCKYQIYYANKLNIPFSVSLVETVKSAILMSQKVSSQETKHHIMMKDFKNFL